MNIFYVSDDPQECARALDDKRLNKMCTETAQILSTAVRKENPNDTFEYLYKSYNTNGQIVNWCVSNLLNFRWTIQLWYSLLKEYQHRKSVKHGSSIKASQLLGYKCYSELLPDTFPPKFVTDKTRGIDCSHIDDTREAYKAYLNAKWATDKHEPKWTNRERPVWADFERL